MIEVGDIIEAKGVGEWKRLHFEIQRIDKEGAIAPDWFAVGNRIKRDRWNPGRWVPIAFGMQNKGFIIKSGDDAPKGYINIGKLR